MTPRRLAAIFGFLGVALGAFGAHALKDRLSADGVDWWKTATLYHLVHAVAMLAADRRAAVAFAVGIALFSGSLYVMALTEAKWLGAVTPVGGIAFLVGWALLIRDRT